VLVGDQFSDRNCEGDLHRACKTTEKVTADQGVDVLRDRAHDARDKGQEVAADEEPSPAKDIGKTANDEKADCQAKCVRKCDPGDLSALSVRQRE